MAVFWTLCDASFYHQKYHFLRLQYRCDYTTGGIASSNWKAAESNTSSRKHHPQGPSTQHKGGARLKKEVPKEPCSGCAECTTNFLGRRVTVAQSVSPHHVALAPPVSFPQSGNGNLGKLWKPERLPIFWFHIPNTAAISYCK